MLPQHTIEGHEAIGIALQRIGSIIEDDPNATVSFTEERDVDYINGTRSVTPRTTSLTLEVSGVEDE